MQLKEKVLKMVIERLGLEDDIDVNNYEYDMPLFETEIGLGLDSVDVLELFVGMKKDFGIKVPDDKKEVFKSVTTMSDYILQVSGE
ncbi:acyl carrier protein [Lachnotalea glycerini]|uniref:Acyl carrier protein n=1 Tax=Lachnotalea glycerini TaxID=1763509 RepID=A0A318EQL9_9FIRM|nr:phosphopantetheine-binding protein [Lachnotalea glycerini]PXV93246.1 acyl carrier protein [Lachnotalea glycerini]